MDPAPFRKVYARLGFPTHLTQWVGAAVAGGYCCAELDLTLAKAAWLVAAVAVVGGAGAALGMPALRRATASLRGLAAGDLAPSPGNVRQAVRELFDLPDRVFRLQLFSWCVTAAAVGFSAAYLPGGAGADGLRLFAAALCCGLSSSLAAHVLLLQRARTGVGELLAAGVSAQAVLEAPRDRRQLRIRLVLFTLITVAVPTWVAADVALAGAHRAFARVLTAPDLAARGEIAGREAWVQPARVAVAAAVFILAAYLSTRVAASLLQDAFEQMSAQARRVAGGDLRPAALIPAEDEVWAASTAFFGMQNHLGAVLKEMQRAGTRIGGVTAQIDRTAGHHRAGTQEQAAGMAETLSTSEEVARSARQVAKNAGEVAKMADEMLAAAKAGQSTSQAFAESMRRMRDDNQSIADSVVRLNKRVQQIGRIVEFITGIADKSDLLALNAELEGTKAGEVGRGFSLVAAEMRRVAENVTASTTQIAQLIEEIRDATHAAVMATEAGVKTTDAGARHSIDLFEKLSAIVGLAEATSQAVRVISLGTQQQQAGTDQLAATMADVLAVTQKGEASHRELGAANQDLASLAAELLGLAQRFRVS